MENNGDLVGIENGNDGNFRDELSKRLEGICCGSIKPSVTPRITWAIESNHVVLAIIVAQGREPVYYSQGKPYVRHISTSRPAEPHEVVELILRYKASHISLGDSEDREGEEESDFYSELGSQLHEVLLWAETPGRERSINPWFEEWRADCEFVASNLRELAAGDIAVRLGFDERMREIADALTEVSTFRTSLGNFPELEKIATRANDLVWALKKDTIDTLPISDDSASQVRSFFREESRKLYDLRNRAIQLVNEGRVDELQAEMGLLGSKLVKLSFYDLSTLGGDISRKSREVGMRMRLLQVNRISLDGGTSMQRFVNTFEESANQFIDLANEL